MERQYFSLEIYRATRLTRIFQVIFGFICAIIAVIWAIMNVSTMKSSASLWITIILLLGFAYYQVMSGFGLAEKFLEVGRESIRLKKNSLLPGIELKASEIELIEIFPFNIRFHLSSGKDVILRYGTTFTDIIDRVNKSIEAFCLANKIKFEFKREVL